LLQAGLVYDKKTGCIGITKRQLLIELPFFLLIIYQKLARSFLLGSIFEDSNSIVSNIDSAVNFNFQNKQYQFKRYPHTQNKSLQAWNAADELILQYISENEIDCNNSIICNDSFGVLQTVLNQNNPQLFVTNKSQEKACLLNFETNKIIGKPHFIYPFSAIKNKPKSAIIKIPKSLDLFELFLSQIVSQIDQSATVICGFMTKHFSKQIIEIANKYFETADQSKAWKKARLLVLKKPLQIKAQNLINTVQLPSGENLSQYYGVFSAKHVDYASLFLIENLKINEDENRILDLASGNGVLAYSVQGQKPDSEIHLIDDSFLAVESSKMNLKNGNVHFHYNDCMDDFQDSSFDLIITNPPFHFGHENNIEVSLRLFNEAYRCIKPNGRLLIVANLHLNYRTQLNLIFKTCTVLSQNEKFVIYECIKEC